MQREVCWQCGKEATELLWYHQGGKGWVQRPVCDLGDAHPWDVWAPANEMAHDDISVLQASDVAGATQQAHCTTSVVAR